MDHEKIKKTENKGKKKKKKLIWKNFLYIVKIFKKKIWKKFFLKFYNFIN